MVSNHIFSRKFALKSNVNDNQYKNISKMKDLRLCMVEIDVIELFWVHRAITLFLEEVMALRRASWFVLNVSTRLL